MLVTDPLGDELPSPTALSVGSPPTPSLAAGPMTDGNGAPATASIVSLQVTAFDAGIIGMAVLGADGRWLLVNPAVCELLGYTARELAADTFQALLLAPDRMADLEQFRELAAGRLPAYQVERQLMTKAGRPRWVRISLAQAKDQAGEVLGVIANLEDIEGRRDLEASTSSSLGELRRSNTELEVFASVAAHDLQEPLRKIRTFGDRLEQRFAPVLGETGIDYLHRMQASAERMQRLIDDLLTYARIATRGQPFVAVDLETIARDVAADLETRLEQSGGELRIGPLPTVAGDPVQLRQLVQNLVANALKFAAPERAPLVCLEASAGSRPGQVSIVVRDNGIGFDPAYTSRIFEPFERLHGRSEYEGTGIGLAIARRIAERHGGTIRAESVPDVGSTFSLTLPLEVEELST